MVICLWYLYAFVARYLEETNRTWGERERETATYLLIKLHSLQPQETELDTVLRSQEYEAVFAFENRTVGGGGIFRYELVPSLTTEYI